MTDKDVPESVLPIGQWVNIDDIIFGNILNLWFNTSDVKNAASVDLKDIIKCCFSYYTIVWLCSYSRCIRDLDDFSDWERKWNIYSNGRVTWTKRTGAAYYGADKTEKGCYKGKEILNTEKIASFLMKLQINFSQDSVRSSVSYDTLDYFKHNGIMLAKQNNLKIIDYKKTELTEDIINDFYHLFDLIEQELMTLEIKPVPSFQKEIVSINVSSDHINIKTGKSWDKKQNIIDMFNH